MKRYDKQSRIAVAIALIILVLVSLSFTACKEDSKTYKIGGVFTLTGGTAYWSEKLQKGMDIALEEENRTGTTPIEILYEDVQGQAQLATSAFQKLSEIENASVILSVFTPISQPLRPLAERANVPLLATVVSVRDFAKDSKWSFRDFLTQEQMASPLGVHAVTKLGLSSAAALVVNDDYGRDGAKAFSESFQQQGGKWLGQETFEQKDVDIRSQATKISALKAQAVLVVGRDQSLGLAIKQLYEAGYRGQLLSVNCLDDPKVWEIAGSAVENAVFASAYVDFQNNSDARAFRDKYYTKYNVEPDYVAVYGYTIIKCLAPLLRDSDGDRAKIREALEKLDVDSMRGRLRVNAEHDVLSPVALYKVNQNQKQIVETP